MGRPLGAIVTVVAVATAIAPGIGALTAPLDGRGALTATDDGSLPSDAIVQLNRGLTEELAALDGGADDAAAAESIGRWQAAVLELGWTEPEPMVGFEDPEPALAELAARSGATLSADERTELAELDEGLHPEVSQALASWVDAFLALDTATELAFADTDVAALQTIAQAASDPADVLEAPSPTASPLPAGLTGPNALAGIGVDLAPVFPTRVQFLEATHALEGALAEHHEPADHAECSPVQEAGVFSLSLETCDNHYEEDFRLLLDVGGADTYHNNAGGNNLGDGCPSFDPGAPVPAPAPEEITPAALVDLAGDDVYGDPADRGACGVNGGATAGVGFLRDVAGDDVYHAGNLGTNGGGFLAGVGFLQDVEGDDLYVATEAGANGGGYLTGVGHLQDQAGNDEYRVTVFAANGGGGQGVGSLWDIAGDDLYAPAHELSGRAGQGGIHGAATIDGVGFLLDASGDDTYEGTSDGVNGGGRMAVGHLADLAGDDTYEATHTGVNGAAATSSLGTTEPRGLLYDGQGTDTYVDTYIEGGSCEDCTVYPKGTDNGAQIDGDDPPDPTAVPPPSPPATPVP